MENYISVYLLKWPSGLGQYQRQAEVYDERVKMAKLWLAFNGNAGLVISMG